MEEELKIYKMAFEILANDYSGALYDLARNHIWSDDCGKSPKEVQETYLSVARFQNED